MSFTTFLSRFRPSAVATTIDEVRYEVWTRLQSRYYRLLLRLHDNPALPEARRDLVLRELRLRDDTRLTVFLLFVLMLATLVFAAAAQRQGAVSDKVDHGASLAVLWGLATLAAAALVGFLFGIPRAAQSAGVTGADAGAREARASGMTPNTNLEQISDWLTKIIVGVGLVESREIAASARRMATFMADADGGIISPSLGLAILVAFSGLGFLMGYLATRMFLSPAFSLADGSLGFDPRGPVRKILDTPVEPDPGGGGGSSSEQSDAARHSARALLAGGQAPRLDDPFDVRYAHAKALLLARHYERAIPAYGALIAERGDDPRLRRERLWARFKAGERWDRTVESELAELADLRDKEPDPASTYLSLAFHYLYADRPKEAQRVIELVNEFEQKHRAPDAGMRINRACAYAALARHGAMATAAAAAKAATDLREAIRLDPGTAKRIRKLMRPGGVDDDLAIFASEPAVQAAVGVPLPPGQRQQRQQQQAPLPNDGGQNK